MDEFISFCIGTVIGIIVIAILHKGNGRVIEMIALVSFIYFVLCLSMALLCWVTKDESWIAWAGASLFSFVFYCVSRVYEGLRK